MQRNLQHTEEVQARVEIKKEKTDGKRVQDNKVGAKSVEGKDNKKVVKCALCDGPHTAYKCDRLTKARNLLAAEKDKEYDGYRDS